MLNYGAEVATRFNVFLALVGRVPTGTGYTLVTMIFRVGKREKSKRE
jgi:hypothetical protein